MERKCFHIFILLYFYFSEFPACIRVIQLPSIIWDPWNPLQFQLGFLSLLMLQLERKYCSKYFLQCTNTYKNSCYNCWKIKPSMWRSYFQMVCKQTISLQLFQKAVFHKIYLIHPWILCPKCFEIELQCDAFLGFFWILSKNIGGSRLGKLLLEDS